MNKIFIAGALALAATSSTLITSANADPRNDRYDQRQDRRDDRRDDKRGDRQENAANRIEQAFRNDRVLSRYKLGADTVGNRIELEGRVSNPRERAYAIRVAENAAPRQRIDARRLTVR